MTITGQPTVTYAYDRNNRLLTETKAAADATEVTKYGYDNNGNQLWKAKETLKPAPGGAASFNVYVAGQTPRDDIELFEYDGFNQLTQSIVGDKTTTYSYNGDGLRITKNVNGTVTNHVWDGSSIVMELNNAGSITAEYLRGINLIAADMAGNRNYYLYNGHGDVIQLTQADGTVIKDYDYDAFGNEKNANPADINPFRYCGEYFDQETGTYYLRARYYNPGVGRFITENSYWGSMDDPLSLNLYTYCKNNPVAYIDPSGHFALAPLIPVADEALKAAVIYGGAALATGIAAKEAGEYLGPCLGDGLILDPAEQQSGVSMASMPYSGEPSIGLTTLPLKPQTVEDSIRSIPLELQSQMKIHVLPMEAQDNNMIIYSEGPGKTT
ncbi:RHS repeat-associated core domain-containing protein [Vallitalea pronyensis]|uniref:RHS repeat-associated core domain-containing protein n=1 Tax=Vallitalea pronyensis TaxID=1348613 RepID=A0A8J8MIH0_9FIRM|nr:RHS repeat-associated core domain-containing protein [Vallitalea pronyensis]QUI22057.1 RHS repeat-associated core domain-containing protein [Vallitalea pronyensis]